MNDILKGNTSINEKARRELGITRDEYALCSYIHYRLADQKQNPKGFCCDHKQEIADFVGISRRGLYKMLARMEYEGLLLTSPENGFLCTTHRWIEHDSDVNKVPKVKKDECELSSHEMRTKLPKSVNKVPGNNKVKSDKSDKSDHIAAKAAKREKDKSKPASNEGKKQMDRGAAIGYDFETFWKDYDFRKGSKKNTLAKWLKITVDEIQMIQATLEMYKRDTTTDDTGRNQKNFKPMRKYPVAYINQKAWEVYAELKTELAANDVPTEYDGLYQQYLAWVEKTHPKMVSCVAYLSKDQYISIKTRKYNPAAQVIGDESEKNILGWAHDGFSDNPLVSKEFRDVFSYHCQLINDRLKARQV